MGWTLSAFWRLRPRPPARVERRKTNLSESSAMNASICCCLSVPTVCVWGHYSLSILHYRIIHHLVFTNFFTICYSLSVFGVGGCYSLCIIYQLLFTLYGKSYYSSFIKYHRLFTMYCLLSFVIYFLLQPRSPVRVERREREREGSKEGHEALRTVCHECVHLLLSVPHHPLRVGVADSMIHFSSFKADKNYKQR